MVRVLLAVVLAAAPLAARGGEAPVDARDTEAKKACAAGQAQRGIELPADYYAESGDEMAIYNQGRCYQQNDMPRMAIARFKEFLRVARKVARDLRHQTESHIQELEADLQRQEQAQRAPAPAVFVAPPPPPPPAPAVIATAAPPA